MSAADQNDAAARREARRRKILMSSEDRMKKILGQGGTDNSSTGPTGTSTTQPAEMPPCATAPPSTSSSASSSDSPIMMRPSEPASYEPNSYEQARRVDSAQSTTATGAQQNETTDVLKEQPLDLAFIRFRHGLCFIVGVLVRISFLYSFGELYVQTMLNPFVALQIALVGYQKSTGMDLGMNVKGGLWLSALILSGINPDIIRKYKSVMGVLTAMVDDFTVFFFGFVFAHLLVW